jgi:hypothetical protein
MVLIFALLPFCYHSEPIQADSACFRGMRAAPKLLIHQDGLFWFFFLPIEISAQKRLLLGALAYECAAEQISVRLWARPYRFTLSKGLRNEKRL